VRPKAAKKASVLREKLTAQYHIWLKPRNRVAKSAYLEVEFENPLDPKHPIRVGKALRGAREAHLESPPMKGISCRNYLVTVRLFTNRSKARGNARPLGVHRQAVQSRVDLERVNSASEPFTELLDASGPYKHCSIRWPIPPNMVSEYLETTHTGFTFSTPPEK